MTSAAILENSVVRQAVLPITVDQYHRLGEAAILGEDTELLRGLIVRQMVKSPLDTWIVAQLFERLRELVSVEMHVRQEQPLTFSDSEPEPDLAVVRGPLNDYRLRHPSGSELVIEVAIDSPELDRSKLELYASAGVGEVWIVLAKEKTIEVYREPRDSGYARMTRYVASERIPLPMADGRELSLDW